MLQLTTPLMTGPNVKALQKALKEHGYLRGNVDGVFGEETATAVYRAKYWLGYRKPDQVAETSGGLLLDLLEGKEKPSPLMKARIANRKRALKKTPVRLRMWNEALKWIHTKESPSGSNRVKFSLWYGIVGPWCAMFVSWCGVEAKSKAFKKGVRYAYVPYVVADARAGRNNLAVTHFPQKGDLVCFDWNSDGVADHIELFGEWTKIPGIFTTIGGNTGRTNASNGGEVLRMERNKRDVQAFVHVGR